MWDEDPKYLGEFIPTEEYYIQFKTIWKKCIILIIICLLLTNTLCIIICKCPIFHLRFLKPSYLVIRSRHGQKNISPYVHLITSYNNFLSYISSLSNYDDTTVYSIMVKYDSNPLNFGTGNSRSRTAIANKY